jgi:hypothetical protein
MNLSEKFLLAADKKLSNKGKNKNLLDTTSRLIEAGLETGATSSAGVRRPALQIVAACDYSAAGCT